MRIYQSRKVAIETRYLGPTNFRGSRYKAGTESGRRITIEAADNLSAEENHRAAAVALCEKMGWTDGDLIEGGTPKGYVYVFVSGAMAKD